jgi:hypothetical protein
LSVGDRAVLVEAQQLAERIAQVLRLRRVAVLADADVELAVGAEVHAAAVVVGRAREVGQVDQRQLAARGGDVARSRRSG